MPASSVHRSVPSMPNLAVTPTLILIILGPSMILLLSGAPVKSSPVPTELKLGHPVLDMNRNPMMKSTRASLHGREHPHTVHQTGLHSRAHHQLPQVRKRRAENSINQKDMDEEKTTLPEIISTTEGKMYIGAGGDPKTPGICYTLCKDGMGGIACDCDLLPIG